MLPLGSSAKSDGLGGFLLYEVLTNGKSVNAKHHERCPSIMNAVAKEDVGS